MTDPRLEPRTVTIIDCQTLNEYVSEHYGRPYNLQQQGEMLSQGSSVPLTVPGSVWDDHYQAVPLEEWLSAAPPNGQRPDYTEDYAGWQAYLENELRWDREFYPMLEAIGNDLHAKGLLDAGEYIIHVDW